MDHPPALQAAHAKLKAIRSRKDLKLRPTPYMRERITMVDGSERDFVLRYYQVQMVLHLLAMNNFVVGDDTGLGKCVTRDTLIDTNQGLVPIGTLQPERHQMPDTFEPVKGWQVRIGDELVPVKSFYNSGSKPTRRIRTRYGFEVEGSLVHPLLARGAAGEVWQQTQHLEPGDFLCVERGEGIFPSEDPSVMIPVVGAQVGANAKTYPVPNRLNPPLARLLGYIVGEAWSNNPWVLSISQCPERNPEAFRDIRNLLQEQFGWESEIEIKDTLVHSVFLRRYLEYMGVDYVTAHDKRVPDPVLRGTRDSVREFLRGLFEGEAGAIGTGGVEFSTASEKLGREVQLLLLRFGIVANRSPKHVKGYDHTYWRLTLFGDDARRFADEIGFVSSRKRERLDGVLPECSNPNHDVAPFTKPLIEALREPLAAACVRLGWRISTRWGSSFYNTMGHVRHGRRNPTYRFLRQLLEVCREADAAQDSCALHLASLDSFKAIETLSARHYFYDPVVEVTEGFKEVVDIEVGDPRHCFTGNGLVNHNTIETIASLAYIWEKRPDYRVIILAKKSAVPQWAKEFARFTQGVNVVVNKGTPVKRRKLYEQFDALPTDKPAVMIMGYSTAKQDFKLQMQHREGYIFVADECFQYHTPIQLADGTTELIGKIVTQRLEVEVLSWNPETGEVEPRRVVDWHRNPLVRGRRKSLLKIKCRFGGSKRVTRSHAFYSVEGSKILAGKLRKGSEVAHVTTNAPSPDQWQVVLGGLLGDSSIAHPKNSRWGAVFTHSQKQSEWLEFKRALLSPLGVSAIHYSQAGFQPLEGAKVPVGHFQLRGNEALTSFLVRARVRQSKRKSVTLDWLDRVGPLGLSVWYADDGSLKEHTCVDGTVTRRITLHTEGFTKQEVELLAGWLRWKWGVGAVVKSTERGHHNLYLPKEAAKTFLDLLPWAMPGVEYKFPDKPRLTLNALDTKPRTELVLDWVTSTSVWKPSDVKKDKYVYNIEVEGNHNYVANGTLVANCHMFKNPKTQIHKVCRHMADQASRIWGLSATIIKNNLVEGYGIFRVIMPGLFAMTQSRFVMRYCVVKMQRIKGNRQIPVIVGYRPTDIKAFRDRIDPFFLGRPKHSVADELPVLTTRIVETGMTNFQWKKYKEAIDGLLQLGTHEEDPEGEVKEVTPLTAVTYCQEITGHPCLIGYEDEQSGKLKMLGDLLTEGGDFADTKVIIFSRFERMVTKAIDYLSKKGVKCVRVTGKETEDERAEAQDKFQDPKSDTQVVFITLAGGDSINLQTARALIFYDTPWSAGDYIQILGRMIRIGSVHDRVYALHLVCKDTIDQRVMKVIRNKLDLIEAIIGKRILGEDDEVIEFDPTSDLNQLYESLLEDAKGHSSNG